MNTERVLKHAVQERLAITICINKVSKVVLYEGGIDSSHV